MRRYRILVGRERAERKLSLSHQVPSMLMSRGPGTRNPLTSQIRVFLGFLNPTSRSQLPNP